MDVYLRILRYLRPYRWRVALGLACLLVATPLSLVHPWIWKYIVDEVVTKRQIHLLAPALAVMVAAHLSGSVLNALRGNILEKVGQCFVRDLRNEVYRKLQGQSLQYLHEHRSGDLVSRAMGDIDVLQEVAVNGTESILSNIYSFVIVAGSLVVLSPVLGSITIAPILVVAILARSFNVRVKQLYRAGRDRLGDVSARLQENLMGAMVVKAFAKEAFEARRFRETTEEYRKVQFRAVNARSIFLPMTQFVGFISNVLAVGVGAWLILQGRFTIGGLVAYRGYWWQLYSPVSSLAQINDLIQRGAAAGARVFELLDEGVTVRDAPDARELREVRGRVTFEEVCFGYRERPVLRGINLDVRPGEVIAMVGSSGAGKSTLLSLIPRFWDPQSGRVLVDGQDVRTVTQASLRSHMAMVLQETFLFSGTVLDNVRYARPEATLEEARRAAEAANALEFIEAELPNGWETQIGERGVKLSGGQRQRISIARAFLADPEILILDEATSAVEPESEWIIQQALERLMSGRTTFIISHRLSIVRGADRIVALDEGRIVEEGTHEQLLARGGLYADMYRMQMGHLAGAVPDRV
ncbi:MAG TPA: ABC transporter ATP-binding protein [Armatimonadota bacterium]|nr:ABC transporter ATP-binding protein [Armatimonadota bacterium]